MRMDQYGSVHQDSSILASQSRRDTIAGFFNENDSSPVQNQGSNFKDDTVNMDISSPATGHYSFLNSAASVENSPAPVAEKKQKYRARDSIACFFESPKYRSIVKSNRDSDEDSQDGHDIESCVEMETSSQSSITEDIPHEKSEKSNISSEPGTFPFSDLKKRNHLKEVLLKVKRRLQKALEEAADVILCHHRL